MQARDVAPTIVQLRDTIEKVRREEIERHRRLLRDLPADQQQAALAALDQVTQSLMNKILHHPIAQMKEMSGDPQGAEFIETVRKIFNIKPQ
jgi:glutamyl-tRNA reductase